MKELSIEEKAKAYDEALKAIKECTPDENGFITIYPQEIFPELKESEDERIRKDMIETIKKESKDFPSSVIAEKSHTWLAWLEKQGEQKPAEVRTTGYWNVQEVEQKPADKVEPKFKVGDGF